MQLCGKTPGQARSEPRPGPDRARATHAKSRPQPIAGWLLVTPNCHMPGSHRHPKTHPHPVPRTGPQWGKSLREQGPGRESGVTPPPSPGATGLHPPQAALCRPRHTRGDPHTPKSPPARSSRSGRGVGGSDFLDSFCASETEQPRGLARHSLHGAPPRGHPVRGGPAGARDEWGSPPPRGSPRRRSFAHQPQGRQTKGTRGQMERLPKLTGRLPLPKTKKPPHAPALWGAAPSGYCSACRERAAPQPEPRGQLGTCPSRAPAAGGACGRPEPPARPTPAGEVCAPPPRARRPGPAHSPRRGQGNLWGAAAPSLPPAGRRRAGPSRGRGGPGAPEQPRAAPRPPPPRRVP